MFTAGAGNTYVLAFCTSFGSAPASAASLAAVGVAPGSLATGTQLNIALNQNGTYVDVGTAQITASGNFQSTPATVALPGITQSGSYLVYVPAAGTNTTQINLGFALIADDSTGTLANGLQFVQLEDGNGNALPTPTTQFFPVTGGDLDGQSLTPDASRGAVIDGGNNVYFFSGLAQHTFALAAGTVSVSAYGGDGDSIVSLPNGDQVVVTADGGGPLVVISGILSGNPVVSDTISNGTGAAANGRDGLVLSRDGKVMLARGYSSGTPGIDVYSVAQTPPHAGSTGVGTTSYSFTKTATLASFTSSGGTVATTFFEDGRDAMAISPADSSRAVVAGATASGGPTIQLLTGLTGATPTIQSTRVLNLPAVRRAPGAVFAAPEPSGHRLPFALTPSTGAILSAVEISPDGTTAYVGSDAGIITVSGVNTGNLAQVGSIYAPTITTPGGTCKIGQAGGIGDSMGVTPDGKYLIVDVTSCLNGGGSTTTTQGSGVLLTIPIGPGGALGAPVGQLNQTVSPYNDQIIIH